MEFASEISRLSMRFSQMDRDSIKTEEATKTAMVMPFIMALGYDVFNHEEVIPEFTADYGLKKGEKVDYAIIIKGKPTILFECKTNGDVLDVGRCSQLSRYFANSEARIGVLTDGTTYKFYTDLEQPNKMDQRPFMIFDFLAVDEQLISELKKLHKSNFDLETTLSTASELKYTREIKKIFAAEMESPSEDMVRLFTARLDIGRFTKSVKDQFTPIVRRALNSFIIEKMTNDFESFVSQKQDKSELPDEESDQAEPQEQAKFTTTEEEWEGFYVVKAIMRQRVDVSRVTMRDTKSYCGILLDDNNRKPVCRLHFNHGQKYLGVFDSEKNETRLPIEKVDDIYEHAEKILCTPDYYE